MATAAFIKIQTETRCDTRMKLKSKSGHLLISTITITIRPSSERRGEKWPRRLLLKYNRHEPEAIHAKGFDMNYLNQNLKVVIHFSAQSKILLCTSIIRYPELWQHKSTEFICISDTFILCMRRMVKCRVFDQMYVHFR